MENIIAFKSTQKQKSQPSVGEMLRLYRTRCKFTQSELALRVGLHTDRMVRKWENGQSLPESGRLKKLIEVYLLSGVFTEGQEKEEAFDLWAAVKETFDFHSASFETYIIFDTAWFEA